jgi:hypothetical protein
VTDEEPAVFFLEDEAVALLAGRQAQPSGTGEADIRFDSDRAAELWQQSRAMIAERRKLIMPIQVATLEGFTRAFDGVGEAAGKTRFAIRAMLDILGHRTGRNPRRSARRARQPRALHPVPPIVPPGLSRVDSARRRAARSALLRSRRRVLRHNRALPRPRARIKITSPDVAVTWGDPKRAPQSDRVDATLFALTAPSRKD